MLNFWIVLHWRRRDGLAIRERREKTLLHYITLHLHYITWINMVRDDYEFRSGQRFLCYLWLCSWNSVPSWRRLELRPWYPGALLPMIIRSLASPSVYSFSHFGSWTSGHLHAHITPSSSTSPLIFRGCAFSDLVSLTKRIYSSLASPLILRLEASFMGGWGLSPPSNKQKKEKKKKKKKVKKKKEKEKRKKERKKKGTMNSVKLLHIKCCFFQLVRWHWKI